MLLGLLTGLLFKIAFYTTITIHLATIFLIFLKTGRSNASLGPAFGAAGVVLVFYIIVNYILSYVFQIIAPGFRGSIIITFTSQDFVDLITVLMTAFLTPVVAVLVFKRTELQIRLEGRIFIAVLISLIHVMTIIFFLLGVSILEEFNRVIHPDTFFWFQLF